MNKKFNDILLSASGAWLPFQVGVLEVAMDKGYIDGSETIWGNSGGMCVGVLYALHDMDKVKDIILNEVPGSVLTIGRRVRKIAKKHITEIPEGFNFQGVSLHNKTSYNLKGEDFDSIKEFRKAIVGAASPVKWPVSMPVSKIKTKEEEIKIWCDGGYANLVPLNAPNANTTLLINAFNDKQDLLKKHPIRFLNYSNAASEVRRVYQEPFYLDFYDNCFNIDSSQFEMGSMEDFSKEMIIKRYEYGKEIANNILS